MPSTAWIIAIVALFTGTGFGWFVQHVGVALIKDDDWPDVPDWKRWRLAAAGGILSFAAGARVLLFAPNFQPEEVIISMWIQQILAAPGGAAALEALMRAKGGR